MLSIVSHWWIHFVPLLYVVMLAYTKSEASSEVRLTYANLCAQVASVRRSRVHTYGFDVPSMREQSTADL
jgi:hypothetical protein